MTIGVAGLGLIGGSFVKAYHRTGTKVLAYNRSQNILDFAILSSDVAAPLTKDNISECDLIIICVFPEAAASWLSSMAPYIRKDAIVMDACGTKKKVCDLCFPIAEEYGFTFIGAHPMAGTKYSGYKYALPNMYDGQPMVLVPSEKDRSNVELLARVKDLLRPAGFGSVSVTTAEEHDKMIAFTSQMAHVVSSAYIKSPSSKGHNGISAGSYKDMTRVAWLNPKLWSDLLLENKENILHELQIFTEHLQEYIDAIRAEDKEQLESLLDEGRKIKEEIDR